MLYFLVAFIALLTTIRHRNPSTIPLTEICLLDDSCLSSYLHPYHQNTSSYTAYHFPCLDISLDDKSPEFLGHSCHVTAGYKTHDLGLMTHGGPMTHNVAGLVAQHTSHKSFVPHRYHLIPGCRTIFILRWHVNVTANYGTTNKLFYPSYQCCPSIILPIPYSLPEKAEICLHSKCASVSIYVAPCKHHTNSPFDMKEHQHCKYSLLPLVLAVNRIIYLFLNTSFVKTV